MRPLFLLALTAVLVLVALITGCSAEKSPARQSSQLSTAKEAYDAGRFAQSERALGVVLEATPNDVEALRILALCQAAQGKNEAAIVDYRKIVAIQPDDDASWYRMALLERIIGETKDSERHLEQALDLKPGDSSYVDELARTKVALGAYKQAAELWGGLVKSSSTSRESRKELLLLQGQAYQSAKDYGSAKRVFKAALQLDPKDEALRARVVSLN